VNSRREAIAWAIALLSAAVAAGAMFLGQRVSPGGAGGEGDVVSPSVGTRELRRKLLAMESEATGLRAELDRLRRLFEMKRASEGKSENAPRAPLPEAERRARAVSAIERLEDLVARLQQNPTEEVYRGLQEVLLDMYHAPFDDPGPFLEEYEGSPEPLVRTMLLPHLAARLGDRLSDFVSEELAKTDDPGLRAELITQLRVHSLPEKDPLARRIFFDALGREGEPRARQQAIEALAQLGTDEAHEALLRAAASDPDEATRESAIRELARAPATRERLLELLEAEPSERLRTIGRCAATLAEASPAG
jgi:hypothetical protein